MVAERGHLLDAGSGAGADVQLELSGVYRWKEVLAQPWSEQSHRRQGKYQKKDEEDRGVVDA